MGFEINSIIGLPKSRHCEAKTRTYEFWPLASKGVGQTDFFADDILLCLVPTIHVAHRVAKTSKSLEACIVRGIIHLR